MKFFAYIVAALIGFAISHYLLGGTAAAFGSVLISYHLYLLFLVLMAKHEKGLSLPIGQTILTHLAFLVVVAGLPYFRAQIPVFNLISLLIPGLAPFETTWLFSGQQIVKAAEEQKPVDTASATAEDHQEFVAYLRTGRRPFRRTGGTVDDEFKAWLADRARKRAAAGTVVGVSPGPAEEMN